MEELSNYIKTQIAAGIQIQAILAELKNRGFEDGVVTEAFKSAMQTGGLEKEAQVVSPLVREKVQPIPEDVQDSNDSSHKKVDATKVFVIIGASLIVAAVIIAIVSEWSKVGALARTSFLFIPMLLLLMTSYFLSKKPEYREYHDWTLALGYSILPCMIGTVLYQYKIIEDLNTGFFTVVFLISLPVYLVTEYYFKKHYISVLSIIVSYGLFISLLADSDLQSTAISWILLAFSLIILAIGFLLTVKKIASNKVYLTFGTVAMMVALPSAILITINNPDSLDYETNMLIFSLFGFLYLVLASSYNTARLRLQESALYLLKRFIEEVSPFIIIFPFLYAGASNDFYMILALVLSFLFVLASIKIRINSFLYIGAIGLIASVLMISSELFSDSIGWPIVVFIAGFAAIALGLVIKKIVKIRKQSISQEMLLGLGKDTSLVSSGHINGGRVALWVVVAVIISSVISEGIYMLILNRINQEREKSYQEEQQYVPAISSQGDEDAPVVSTGESVSSHINEYDGVDLAGETVDYHFDPANPSSSTAATPNNYVKISNYYGEEYQFTITPATSFSYAGKPVASSEVTKYFVSHPSVRVNYTGDSKEYLANIITFLD